MQHPALSIVAALTGGGGAGNGEANNVDTVPLSAAVDAQPTAHLNGTQWAFLLLAAFIGYFIQRGRGGVANIIGWILIIGAVLIMIAATIGIGNAMNTVGGWISALGHGISWFGDMLQSSST